MSNFDVIYVYDNKGFTQDRYTLQVIDNSDEETYLICSNGCASIWDCSIGSIGSLEDYDESEKQYYGEEIEYDSLPEELKNTIENYFMI